MKTVMKKLLSIVLVAILLVSAVPFQADAAETYTVQFGHRGKEGTDGFTVIKTVSVEIPALALDRFPSATESKVFGDYRLVKWVIDGTNVKFERIRRITGYLVGTLDRFNDGKAAEERDRVKHCSMDSWK